MFSKVEKYCNESHVNGGVHCIKTRRSKIVSRATGRYAATGFDQLLVLVCGRGRGIIYLSPKAIPRFRTLSLVGTTQVFAFSKKSYEEGNYT